MSLKGFHIVFITFSTLLAFGVGIWCLWVNNVDGHRFLHGRRGLLVSPPRSSLMVYGCWFWRKMKRLRLI